MNEREGGTEVEIGIGREMQMGNRTNTNSIFFQVHEHSVD